ncbi:hypothetical protein BEP19_05560 [Ammoniphilus oxalaticus]|uniref:SPOR domain-containing protein n=1 Tax=Ammoniphilus oxalaticus TaxID=66863 RepID=A0A419SIN1_9BACL|nr:hypothetical protein [Ammoniphilus oxalaticus]RKD23894.1 hypothetical protein BEP19_05560 [Ammoniphilus oxalaticus]
MDNNRARITIKLGQADEPTKIDEVPETEETAPKVIETATETEEVVFKKPAKKERRPKKKIDKKTVAPVLEETEPKEEKGFLASMKEVARGKERSDEEQPDPDLWYGPKYVATTGETSKQLLSTPRDSKGILGVMASVTGAVAVGLLFGYVVLSFFQSGMIQDGNDLAALPSSGEEQAATNEEKQTNEQEADEKSSEEPSITVTGASETVSIEVPPTTYYVVQGGVFKDQASAAPYVAEMKSKGWPSKFLGDQPTHLLFGIALQREQAAALAAQFKDTDVFVKEMTGEAKALTVPLKQGAASSPEEWTRWFEQEQAFVGAVGSSINAALSAGQLSAEQMKSITETHRNALQSGRELISKLPESEQAVGNRLLEDFTKGVKALEQYEKQPAVGHLWQAEQALLDAFMSKQQLLASFQ